MATKQIKFKSFGEMIYYIFRKKTRFSMLEMGIIRSEIWKPEYNNYKLLLS